MNVWLMNLKDNRDDMNESLEMSKFEFCRSKGIVGIGWVGYDENSDDAGFSIAKGYINSFKVGDLVWTKDPTKHTYFLCKILSTVEMATDEFHKYDISRFCRCEFIEIGEDENLPKGISSNDLISRHTISKASETVASLTEQRYNENSTSTKKRKSPWKIVTVIFTAIIIIASATAFALFEYTIKENERVDKIEAYAKEYLDGKTFIYSYISEKWIFSFDNGMAAVEKWFTPDSGKNRVEGDITSFDKPYSIDVAGNSMWIEITNSTSVYGGDFISFDSVPFSDIDDWRETTIEEVTELRQYHLCGEHDFYNDIVEKKATCTEEGEAKQLCKECGYEIFKTIDKLAHDYSNGICEECGAEKPKEKVNIEPNTWYSYKKLDLLMIQNTYVTDATTVGNMIAVSHYPVCAHCHVVYDGIFYADFPQLDNPISELYYCTECGGTTIYKLQIRQ